MEKGFKNLQSIARAARKTSTSSEDVPAPGHQEEHEGDSGIGCSDAELEPADATASSLLNTSPARAQAVQTTRELTANQQTALFHLLPRPPPLPLYRPPPSASVRPATGTEALAPTRSPGSSTSERERTPDTSTPRSISIKSILSHTPQI